MQENSGIFTLKEFYSRGVIKLAPDVLVYIGGNLNTIVIAPISNTDNKLNFSDGITSVSVQNNIDPPGTSSASIEIAAPIYGPNSKYWETHRASDFHPYNDPKYNGVKTPIFGPMLEVKIYFKGRFLVDMTPRYYPVFWGFINNVEESYTGGTYKIHLGCADMLHWWAYSTLNVHPVPESNIMAGGGQKLTAFSTIFERSNPFEILYTLTNNMGMHEFVTAAWVAQKTNMQEIYPADLWQKNTAGIMSYWQQRFRAIGGLLKMYGLNGKRVDKNGVQTVQPLSVTRDTSKDSEVGQAVTPKNAIGFNTDINFLKEFEVFADYNTMGTFQAAEYTTKLEIATEVKTRCEYEFFQDTNGNFVFKPPFYNVNVKGLLPYTILPNDIINYSFSTDIEGVITVMAINTVMFKNLKTTSFDLGKGFYMDIDLAKRYGIRYKEVTLQYVTDADMAKALSLGHMSMINAKAVNGSVTIPGRPEIRLGYPIYMEHRDSFHYVKSINHSFDFGGSFTTTLALETERRQVDIPGPSISWPSPVQSTSKSNKNKVYRLWNTSIPPNTSDSTAVPGQVSGGQSFFQTDAKGQIKQDLLSAEYKIVGNTQGEYKIDDLRSTKEVSATTTTVPYSDDQGYRVIGSFPFGRNLNPVLISNEIEDLPLNSNAPNTINLKNVYLVTMARPVYRSESAAMEPLFFDNREGAVPAYLNDNQLGTVPDKLGNTGTDEYFDSLVPKEAVAVPDQVAQPIPEKVNIENIVRANGGQRWMGYSRYQASNWETMHPITTAQQIEANSLNVTPDYLRK